MKKEEIKMEYKILINTKNKDFQEIFKEYLKELRINVKDYKALFLELDDDIANHDMQVLCIMDSSKIAGFAIYQENKLVDDWFFRLDTGFIREFYVTPKKRGNGIACFMEKIIINYFLEKNISILMLTSDEAEEFWVHLGYEYSPFFEAINASPVFIKKLKMA